MNENVHNRTRGNWPSGLPPKIDSVKSGQLCFVQKERQLFSEKWRLQPLLQLTNSPEKQCSSTFSLVCLVPQPSFDGSTEVSILKVYYWTPLLQMQRSCQDRLVFDGCSACPEIETDSASTAANLAATACAMHCSTAEPLCLYDTRQRNHIEQGSLLYETT